MTVPYGYVVEASRRDQNCYQNCCRCCHRAVSSISKLSAIHAVTKLKYKTNVTEDKKQKSGHRPITHDQIIVFTKEGRPRSPMHRNIIFFSFEVVYMINNHQVLCLQL